MLRKLRERLYTEQKGFTLIELLVVVLIIGVLATIALPAFLGQRAKGQDASAKSNARNLVSEIESCFAREESYAPARCAEVTQANTGLPIASATNPTVDWTGTATTFTVTAVSVSGNQYQVVRAGGAITRPCVVAAGANRGGCATNDTW